MGTSVSPWVEGRSRGVQVVAINADGLMCDYSVQLDTGVSSLERECSLADEDHGGARPAAAGARWIGGGDAGGGGAGGGAGGGGGGGGAAGAGGAGRQGAAYPDMVGRCRLNR